LDEFSRLRRQGDRVVELSDQATRHRSRPVDNGLEGHCFHLLPRRAE
jgi:hypothetical protein